MSGVTESVRFAENPQGGDEIHSALQWTVDQPRFDRHAADLGIGAGDKRCLIKLRTFFFEDKAR